jgi:hypothetical protein
MKDSFQINCPVKLKNSLTHVSWWNTELSKLRVEVRKLFNQARNSSVGGDWEHFREAQHAYKKAIAVAERNRWRGFCESIRKVPEASRLHRILSQGNKTYLGCIKLTSGNYTESVVECLGHLMAVHFTDSRRLSSGSGEGPMIEGCYKPREWRLAAKVVYPSEVEWAIKNFEPYKATGIDRIYPILLHEGLKYLVGPLTKIFRANIALRHVPQVWNTAKVLFIPKPGKYRHIYAKDFRPISLTSFLLKTLENLVDRFCKVGPLVKYPLAASQYAYRESRSTETALHHLVSMVERQLEVKEYAIRAFLNIDGTFDSTSINTIKQATIRHQIPEAFVDWTENMLVRRHTIV